MESSGSNEEEATDKALVNPDISLQSLLKQNETISKIEDELTCVICHELFLDAVTLPCAHSFCSQCICGWMLRRGSCPVCRQWLHGKVFRSVAIDSAVARLIANGGEDSESLRATLKSERDGQAEGDDSLKMLMRQMIHRPIDETGTSRHHGSDSRHQSESNHSGDRRYVESRSGSSHRSYSRRPRGRSRWDRNGSNHQRYRAHSDHWGDYSDRESRDREPHLPRQRQSPRRHRRSSPPHQPSYEYNTDNEGSNRGLSEPDSTGTGWENQGTQSLENQVNNEQTVQVEQSGSTQHPDYQPEAQEQDYHADNEQGHVEQHHVGNPDERRFQETNFNFSPPISYDPPNVRRVYNQVGRRYHLAIFTNRAYASEDQVCQRCGDARHWTQNCPIVRLR